VLLGGDGDDLLAGGGGTDVIDGGAGIDTNSFQGIGFDVVATVDENGNGTASYGPVNESFTGIENLTGSDNNDTLSATGEADNVLTGGLGNDVLNGGDGFDTADFSDIDVPVTVTLDAEGNGTATRETGFSVSFADVPVEIGADGGSLNPALSGDFVTEALAGNLYFNVHTNDFNGGEIRGQLDTIESNVTDEFGVQTIVLSASLDAAQEPGPTSDSEATGSGTVTIVVAADGSISYSTDLSITGLATSDLLPVAGFSAIHLHNAPAGVNGPVVLDIIQDAGGDIFGAVAEVEAEAEGGFGDTGDGNVFNEVVETDTLTSISKMLLALMMAIHSF